jgi:hypothetical protein
MTNHVFCSKKSWENRQPSFYARENIPNAAVAVVFCPSRDPRHPQPSRTNASLNIDRVAAVSS